MSKSFRPRLTLNSAKKVLSLTLAIVLLSSFAALVIPIPLFNFEEALAQIILIETSADDHGGTFYGEGMLQVIIEDDSTDSVNDDSITVDIDAISADDSVTRSFLIPNTSPGSQRFEFFLVHGSASVKTPVDPLTVTPLTNDQVIEFGDSAAPAGELRGPQTEIYENVEFTINYASQQVIINYEEAAANLLIDRTTYGSDNLIYIGIDDQDGNWDPTTPDSYSFNEVQLNNDNLFTVGALNVVFVDPVTFVETGDNSAIFEAALTLTTTGGPTVSPELSFTPGQPSYFLTLNDQANYGDLSSPANTSVLTSTANFSIDDVTGTIDPIGTISFASEFQPIIRDADRNRDSQNEDDLVGVFSVNSDEAGSDTETIDLTETGDNTGVFEADLSNGEVPFNFLTDGQTSTPNNGIFEFRQQDIDSFINASYEDLFANVGQVTVSQVFQLTTTPGLIEVLPPTSLSSFDLLTFQIIDNDLNDNPRSVESYTFSFNGNGGGTNEFPLSKSANTIGDYATLGMSIKGSPVTFSTPLDQTLTETGVNTGIFVVDGIAPDDIIDSSGVAVLQGDQFLLTYHDKMESPEAASTSGGSFEVPEKTAFTSTRDGPMEIYVMTWPGVNQTRLTNDPLSDAYHPGISPDALKVAFTNVDGVSNDEIFVINIDGSNPVNLSNNPAEDGRPSFSPDGSKIAFMSNRDGNFEIYVMNADGTGQIRLTNNAAFETGPAFSADGSKIVFTSDRDGNEEVYQMNADGTGQVNLTNNPADDRQPSFSPDGSRITFTSDRDGNNEIYVMNADGTGQINISNNPANDFDPSFSPDHNQIAFVSDRDGDNEIHIMNSDGTAQGAFTNNNDIDIEPNYRPRLISATSLTSINSVSNDSPPWGTPVSVSGTVTGFDTTDTVTINWGDGSAETIGIPINATGHWGPSPDHLYSQTTVGNGLTITAILKSDTDVTKAQDSTQVLVTKRPSVIIANMVFDPVEGTGITASGILADEIDGDPLDGEQITFAGTGGFPFSSVDTTGVVFDGASELIECSAVLPLLCSNDSIGTDPDGTNNVLLLLDVGGTITPPPGTDMVKIWFFDEDPTAPLRAPQTFNLTVTNDAPIPLSRMFTYTTTGNHIASVEGIFAAEGISEIVLQSVDGSTTSGRIAIAAMLTFDTNGNPQDQHTINFEEMSDGPVSDPFTANPGSFFSTTVAPPVDVPDTVSPNKELVMEFAGNSLYLSTNTTSYYDILPDTLNGEFGGAGSRQISPTLTEVVAVSVSNLDCAGDGGDSDGDSLCNDWEATGAGKGIQIGTNTPYMLTGFDPNTPDIYVEMDYWSGYQPTAAEIAAIEEAFLNHNINLHIQLGEALPGSVPNKIALWSDASSARLGGTQTNTPRITTGADGSRSFIIDGLQVVTSGTFTATVNLKAIVDFSGSVTTLTVGTPTYDTSIDGSAIGTPQFSTPVVTAGAAADKKIISFTATIPITGASTSSTGLLSAITVPMTVGPSNLVLETVSTASGSPIITNNNDFDGIKMNFFGSEAERSTAGGTLGMGKAYLQEKLHAYRYAIMARNNGPDGLTCGSSGEAEFVGGAGNDFVVTLGDRIDGVDCFTGDFGSPEERMGTIMHEIGHTVGLRHGGEDDDNCKPNYPSVMSYTRQYPRAGLLDFWVLDYSDFKYPDMMERAMNEPSGYNVSPNFRTVWGILGGTSTATLTGLQMDWNGDGTVNHAGFQLDGSGKSFTGFTSGTATTKTVPIKGYRVSSDLPFDSASMIIKATVSFGNNAVEIDPTYTPTVTRTGTIGTAGGLSFHALSPSNVKIEPTTASTTKTITVVSPFSTTGATGSLQNIGDLNVTFKIKSSHAIASVTEAAAPIKAWSLDLNYVSAIGCNPAVSDKTILKGSRDWDRLQYNFRAGGSFEGALSFGVVATPGGDQDGPEGTPVEEVYVSVTSSPAIFAEITPQVLDGLKASQGRYVGPLQPINDVLADQPGQSIFGKKSVAPLKFRYFDAEGNEIKTGDFRFELFKRSGQVQADGTPEATVSASGDSGNAFTYSIDHWKFNLKLTGLTPGEYGVKIYRNLGSQDPLNPQEFLDNGDGWSMVFIVGNKS